ncbi:MAG: outer membrane protein assembly factor BamA [Saprospirales bacterium]|nr:outer membrane protein assembly factor BamA [Saprospirales bacterium]MBK8490125.1 outer membrane protein assembly factor BamA [Saprospirales bacterium]
MMIRNILILLFLALTPFWVAAQEVVTDTIFPVFNYGEPSDYEIGGIKISGAVFSDENALKSIAGFRVGDRIRIPGGDIPRAMKALWNLKLFTDIEILQEKTIGDIVFLEIRVKERPRLTSHSFRNIKKTNHDDINKLLEPTLVKGGIVTENTKVTCQKKIEKYFVEKGYLDAKVTVIEEPDSARINAVKLVFDADRGERVRIQQIAFVGANNAKEGKLHRLMKETKSKKAIFSASKYIRADYLTDQKSLISYYNTIGYRDAQITGDSMWREEDGDLQIRIDISEGPRYYFRNISWKGNSIYTAEQLTEVLAIKKGDVYNQELLEKRLQFSEEGRDISSLYMDNGYLFFNIDPIEVAISGDSLDLEMRIFEGPQATIDKVVINGNDRTHEHVIRRELRTLPGDKFSRSDIIRSQRQIMNLGYFNPESLDINTPVNPQRGTVDIEYTVEERPSDQLELSAGWGGVGRGVIGTLGVSFNNFSARNIFKKETWSPLPQGDGQRLSIRAQTNGRFFQSYNLSFTEPWLGGKKPNSFTAAGFYTRYNISGGTFGLGGATFSLGTRLKFPDDNFVSSTSINLENIQLSNWYDGLFRTEDGEIVTDGQYHNFSVTQNITRSTINNPLFPQEGSRFSLSLQLTPPYSLFSSKPYADLPVEERFKWLEYHKWRFTAEWYAKLVGNLTLKTEAKIGMIGAYNKDIGISPFERFQLGGDGLNNQQFGQFNGTDIISMRGYEINEIGANQINGQTVATPIFDKFTVELRYPVSLNPNSTIYVLAFAQGGNAFRTFRDFNPFDLKRSAGIGLRVFLPMFGILGFDYGLGFDKDTAGAGNSNIFKTFGNFNIILGFEPE